MQAIISYLKKPYAEKGFIVGTVRVGVFGGNFGIPFMGFPDDGLQPA